MTSIYLLVWLASVVGATYVGSKKGSPFGALFLGVMLGPVGLIITILSGSSNRISCPHCAEKIMKKAKVCPHCQREL